MKTNPWSWSTGPIQYASFRGERYPLPPGWRVEKVRAFTGAKPSDFAGIPHFSVPGLTILFMDELEPLPMKRRSPQAQDLRTPKYRKRVVPNKKRALNKRACRNHRR